MTALIIGKNETDGHPMVVFPADHPEVKQAWDGGFNEEGALILAYLWQISPLVREWLEQNVPIGRWQTLGTPDDARVVFLDESDLIAFRLRWS